MTRQFAGPLIIVWIVGALAGPAGADARQVDALRVHVLDCGFMRAIPTDELLAGVPDAPEKIDMVSRCFLVEHPEGRLLWDTGLPDSFKYAMRRIVFSTMSFGRSGIDQGDELPDQLKELGLDEDDIDYLALSHIHWDHAGGANDFDVFGDGSVVVLSAPGHTPGHQCLFLDPTSGPQAPTLAR